MIGITERSNCLRLCLLDGGVPSTTKPLWKRGVNVIMKNFDLLIILLLLAQMICRLAFNQGSGFDSILIPNSDYERRIAEVDAFLKTTTKLMKVQIEVVHQKIDNEIAGLKTELSKRIDDKGADISKKFSELDGRIESVEKSLTTNWLSKDELNTFLKEFKAKKGG
ncbi:hypothetical protein L1887_21679 [Cichorium endivia]|nr:hypothetical protein L1887_21679 [Cichorium endivia]